MIEKNVFNKDIDIPEVVQKKAEVAFASVKKEGGSIMKKQNSSKRRFVKASIAIAASAVVIAGGTYVSMTYTQRANTGAYVEWQEDTQAQDVESQNTDSVLDNIFTLKVMAEELKPGSALPVMKAGEGKSFVLSGREQGDVGYCIKMPVTCEGENVDKITYEVNKGAFQIMQNVSDQVVVSGNPYDGELKVGQIGGVDSTGTITFSKDQYQSFTVSYDKQSVETAAITVCNILNMTQEDQDNLFGKGSLEDKAASMRKMVDGVEVTCTIQFKDGTSKKEVLTLGADVKTLAELGDTSIKADSQMAVITYQLQ